MFLGLFDYIILLIIFIFNIGIWKYKIIKNSNLVFHLVIFMLFGFTIPYFSIDFEIQKVTKNLKEIDSFTLLYTYFRFPIWWFLGILEIIYLRYQIKTVKTIDG